jgi:extradiol dioxygenase family protein
MDHLAIPVSDQKRSRRYYENISASAPGRRGGTTTAS